MNRIASSVAALAIVTVAIVAGCSDEGGTTTQASELRPTCKLLGSQCHAYEDVSTTGADCHHLGHSKTATEADCAAKKTECLAACPAGGPPDAGATADSGAEDGSVTDAATTDAAADAPTDAAEHDAAGHDH